MNILLPQEPKPARRTPSPAGQVFGLVVGVCYIVGGAAIAWWIIAALWRFVSGFVPN